MVFGLGNPGRPYEKTRHNVGFDVVDELARRGNVSFRRSWFVPAHTAKLNLEGEDVLLVKPVTFMNRSGQAVGPLLRRRGLGPDALIVVLDDADLEKGALRVRRKGSAGGHKGLQSVIQVLGTDEFVRVRVGIGPRPPGDEMVDHVLARFTKEERAAVDKAVQNAADAIVSVVHHGIEKTMNDFNETSRGRKP
jgi:PTH1 family peptidyl-tRNA hydrolase